MRLFCMFHQIKCCISVLNLVQVPIKTTGPAVPGAPGYLLGKYGGKPYYEWHGCSARMGCEWFCCRSLPSAETRELLLQPPKTKKQNKTKKNARTDQEISLITNLRSCLQPLSLKLRKACFSKDSWKAEAHWQILINQSDLGLLFKIFSLFSRNLLLNMPCSDQFLSQWPPTCFCWRSYKGRMGTGPGTLKKKMPCK